MKKKKKCVRCVVCVKGTQIDSGQREKVTER